MPQGDEHPLLRLRVQGAAAGIYFCRISSTSGFEGDEYISSLPVSDQKKFDVRFFRLAALGHLNNPEQFRDEGDGIWFIKVPGHRLACFKYRTDWIVITSGYKKDPKDKKRVQAVERAKTIRAQLLKALNEP